VEVNMRLMAAPAILRSGVTVAGGGTNVQAMGGNSSGDGKITAAVDGNEGPADANSDNTE
jgi:hypothetical protein